MSKSEEALCVLSESEEICSATLKNYHLLNTLPEKEYDSIARLASFICKTPIAIISFLNGENQFLKSHIGMTGMTSPLKDTICDFTIKKGSLLEIADALSDERTSGLDCVIGYPHIRFYAGAPLITPDGLILGSLCVIDSVPGKLDDQQREALGILADEVISHLEAKRKNFELNDLLKRHEEINTMFNSSAELHCILDRDGNIRIMNNVIEKIVGYTIDEAIGKPVWKFIHPDDIIALTPLIENGLRTGRKSFELEARIKLKTGGFKWMGWSVAVKENKWYVNGRDIEEQKKLVSELEQLSLVANKVNNGVVISDSNSRIIWANKASEVITGYTFEDLKGHKLGDRLKGEKTDPDVIRNAREYTQNKKSFAVDLLAYRKDGTPVWVSILNSVVLDADGNVEREVEVIIDITARKKAEEELETLSLVASKSSSGVVIRDGDGKVTWVNSALEKILGYTLRELEGRRLGEVVMGKEGDQKALEIAAKAIAEKKPYSVDLLVNKKDGSPIWLHSSTTPILNEAGEIERQVEIINDISERKYAEEQLTLLSLVASKTVNGGGYQQQRWKN